MNQRDDHSYELISAFLDGEVSPDERARVEQLVASSAEHRQTLEDMRAMTRGMQRLPDYYLDDDFSKRVCAIARQTSGVAHEIDAARLIRFTPAAAVWYWPAVVGLATTAAAAALIAFFVGNVGTEPTGSAGSQKVAQTLDVPPDSTRDELTASNDAPLAIAPGRDNIGPAATAPLADQPPSSSEVGSTPDELVHADWPPSEQPTISSESASTREAAPPVPMVAAAELATAGSLPDQSNLRDPAASHDGERLPEPSLNDVPFLGTQQLLLVIDVALTQQGAERGAFERVLAAQRIPVEGTVPVDRKLEESLLASRFFEPLQTPPGSVQEARSDMALMYVGAQAGHVDEICSEMQSNVGEFANISFDMAFLPNDQALFQKLQLAVQQRPADAPLVADEKLQERHAAAHRLALPPNWRGTLSPKLKSVDGLKGLVPDSPLKRDAAKEPLIERVPRQPLPRIPQPPGGRLGENINAEVLFVVHVGSSTQE